ncbi:subunit of heterotrimeric replication protein a [Stylonychia lemnae]|uniref:Subunit of heterotrimeric replication protein a n=1 Tax=Stylonychia lemnae TaxID=5949 RepID=A0A078ATY3_STYLE|nr:subunit of heterotrimeric replication protein a [Stylonychia lemnae]|eukprot:CDW85719.1 subunit of heterotrimeric replication protein a [Stylonychia lemnae]
MNSCDWVIKAKIMKKSERKMWFNDRGQGLLINLDLMDAFGSTIQATFFKDAVEKYDELLIEGNVYVFTGGNVKQAHKKFNNMSINFSLAFDKQALVKEIENEQQSFQNLGCLDNLKMLNEIQKLNFGQKCDFIGIIEQVGHTNQIPLKTGEKKSRANLMVADESNCCALLCIWGRDDIEIQEPDPNNPTVIYVRNAKIASFGNFSLNSNDESVIIINPISLDVKVDQLKVWYRNQGKRIKLKHLTIMNEYFMNNFGFTRNLRLPFSTPNSIGAQQDYVQNN